MKRIELTEEQFKVMQDALTKEQITVIREALSREMDRLRDMLCVLYDFDDLLTDTLCNKDEQEDMIVDEGEAFYDKDLVRDSNDDPEEM